jgi:iron complex transport system ATP-binding protein
VNIHQTVSQLEAINVSCVIGTATLLQPMSVQFSAGRVTAILGPNGAGKSTLLSLLSGQRKSSASASGASAGVVRINGRSLSDYPGTALARFRAVLPQDTSVAFDYTVRDVVALGRFPHTRQPSVDEAGIVQAAMQVTGVDTMAGRIINTLSGGERARAQLARVLAQIWEPVPGAPARWLLLDEPTAALDLSNQHDVLRLTRVWARQRGVGVVAVLHDLNLALRYADQVLVLDGGAVQAQGAANDVLNANNVSQIWRVRAREVLDVDGTRQLLVA